MRLRFNANAGFSLIEMMTVLIVLGIVLAAAVPNVGRYLQHDTVRAEARKFQSYCQVAQQQAQSSRIRHRVVYDPAQSCYYIERAQGGSWSMASADTTILPSSVTMSGGVEGNPTRHIITFEPWGTVAATDVPARVRFVNFRNDSSSVSIVRTGRMIVRGN